MKERSYGFETTEGWEINDKIFFFLGELSLLTFVTLLIMVKQKQIAVLENMLFWKCKG